MIYSWLQWTVCFDKLKTHVTEVVVVVNKSYINVLLEFMCHFIMKYPPLYRSFWYNTLFIMNILCNLLILRTACMWYCCPRLNGYG